MYNRLCRKPDYTYFYGILKNDTVDFHFERKIQIPLNEESVVEYYTHNFDYIVRTNDYTHKFHILKKYLKFLEFNSRFEFEEKVLKLIILNLCSKYGVDLEKVQKKIDNGISYEENFN
ncbi:hypothetical protein [Candidatus Nitrosocosmicus sp. SS]|jgi:hypothetical protein|uniref:hypothetical protein n=1 Tax=Candidatus Nitrosocosmicus agrestis TaxID=2563600 RepID=UPI00122DD5E6|nr:hypothetical protein [Candidatus Nitrosocosmicus sp. SS]KAA2279387.1 hypothetical protein F1Z66_13435 [Candidatus Nitrosocosmicus sp. SS]KAF0868075.1 hypothetical protein E5N71_11980 [Candidatus Nitrosocosmicus sp. SS]